MAEENGEVVGALADLIRSSNLSDEQRSLLLRLSRHKKGYLTPRSHAKGPYIHCKYGDRIEVKYPDGSSEVMTVSRVGPMRLNLSTLSVEQLNHRREVSKIAFGENKGFQDGRAELHARLKQRAQARLP